MRNLDPQNLSQSGLVELQYEYLIVVQKTGNLQPIILKAAEVELPIPNRSRASMDNEPSFCLRTSNNARLKSLIRLDKSRQLKDKTGIKFHHKHLMSRYIQHPREF